MADGVILYAVVRFDGDAERRVDRVILTFPTARSADLFAQFNKYVDYEVAPISLLDSLLRPQPDPDDPGRSVGVEAV
ncbi:hypothetical protein [Frankia sp. Cj5]|uniref:hypothetical protein n=1 Tax=Frankia sp. Cj5 TaxID=2880978 RepID=UPI001EF5DAFC|nr:hypothetical protein [Frankia sp. Cj5]